MISSYFSPWGEAGRGLAFLSRTVIDAPVLSQTNRIPWAWRLCTSSS